MKQRVDVTIIGSGFAGSILAWILAKQGLRVALVDAAKHPRFAVGESSTPIADMILRRLGRTYQLSELESLATWGGWQQTHPEITCGRKRGFSYYAHSPGQPYREVELGTQSLLVAASGSDEVADTHWFRAEVDQFFFLRAVQAGAIDLSGFAAVAHEVVDDATYSLTCLGEQRFDVISNWVIDASGQASVLARLSGAADRSDELKTRTHSVYAHYAGVKSWTEQLRQSGVGTDKDPFDADDAAQHHLLRDGWLWMLRFNNQITSVGYTAPMSRELNWSGYPSIESLLCDADLVAPRGGPRRTGRLQRLYDPIIDQRRLLMPTAAVTIDPLHSTGIAHALAGVDRLAEIITESTESRRAELIRLYCRAVLEETGLLDQLVSTAYATMNHFPRFSTACMLYFAAAICCEERYQRGETPTRLWNADDRNFTRFVSRACQLLADPASEYFEEISEGLKPWNNAGLMDPAVSGRYAYTATNKS